MCFKCDANVTCCNCGGNHEATSLECPTRVKENGMANVRAVQRMSYAVAVRRVKGSNGAPEESMVLNRPSLKAAGFAVQQQYPNMLKLRRWTMWSF